MAESKEEVFIKQENDDNAASVNMQSRRVIPSRAVKIEDNGGQQNHLFRQPLERSISNVQQMNQRFREVCCFDDEYLKNMKTEMIKFGKSHYSLPAASKHLKDYIDCTLAPYDSKERRNHLAGCPGDSECGQLLAAGTYFCLTNSYAIHESCLKTAGSIMSIC